MALVNPVLGKITSESLQAALWEQVDQWQAQADRVAPSRGRYVAGYNVLSRSMRGATSGMLRCGG